VSVNPSTSSFSDAIICVDEVLDAANALPEPARRLLAAVLRERSPLYCWTVDRHGRLECRHALYPVTPEKLRPWASEEMH
jgi:hypothetical protein